MSQELWIIDVCRSYISHFGFLWVVFAVLLPTATLPPRSMAGEATAPRAQATVVQQDSGAPSPLEAAKMLYAGTIGGDAEAVKRCFDQSSEVGQVAARALSPLARQIAAADSAVKAATAKYGTEGVEALNSAVQRAHSIQLERVAKLPNTDAQINWDAAEVFWNREGDKAVVYIPFQRQPYTRVKRVDGRWYVDVTAEEISPFTRGLGQWSDKIEQYERIPEVVKHSGSLADFRARLDKIFLSAVEDNVEDDEIMAVPQLKESP